MASHSPPLTPQPQPDGSHVHFDDTCVLIPDPVAQPRIPRLVKKSYSLPLWRRRSTSNPPVDLSTPSEASGSGATVRTASPTEDKPMVFTVSVPSFSRSRSLSRSESASSSTLDAPLVPCIVNLDPALPRLSHSTHTHGHGHAHLRRPSLPLPPRPDVATVPLRPCCAECYPVTEESIREDIIWEEKFTRAARRRRNSSADAQMHAHVQRHKRVADDVPGFEAIVSVDEVDKRHGTSGVARAAEPQNTDDDDVLLEIENEHGLLPSFSRRMKIHDLSSPTRVAISEADEDLLDLDLPNTKPSPELESDAGFPLPIDKRDESPSSHIVGRKDESDDNLLLLQGASSTTSTSIEVGHGPGRVSADHEEDEYATPESSPALPALEPSFASCSSPTLDTPRTPHTVPVAFRAVDDDIDFGKPSHHTGKERERERLFDFELPPSPTSPTSPLAMGSYFSRQRNASRSPDASPTLPFSASPSASPTLSFSGRVGERERGEVGGRKGHRARGKAGSFFRAGAEMLKGVSLGGGVPMSL